MKASGSNSDVQIEAEKIIEEILSKELEINLGYNKRLYFKNSYVIVDAYSKEKYLLVEIYAHVGKLKVAQQSKVQNDILKMLYVYKKQILSIKNNCCL